MRGRVSAVRLACPETCLCDLATTIPFPDLAVESWGEEATASWPASGPHDQHLGGFIEMRRRLLMPERRPHTCLRGNTCEFAPRLHETARRWLGLNGGGRQLGGRSRSTRK